MSNIMLDQALALIANARVFHEQARTKDALKALADAAQLYDELLRLNSGQNGPPLAPAIIEGLKIVGVDFSVAETDLREWLVNPQFTPYPAISQALLFMRRQLKDPVFLDVIVWNYEHAPGVTSPRIAADVKSDVLHRAIIEGSNTRYGTNVRDFEPLLEPAFVNGSCGTPTGSMSDIQIQTFGSPGGRWSRGMLTFSINSAGANLPSAIVNNIIAGAFAQWQDVSPFFNFTQIGTNGDIRVSFSGAELDSRFGTPGGVVGVGQYPEKGSITFDRSEAWSASGLLSVALHEIGHALGLAHSNDRASLMYPVDMGASTIDPETQDAIRNLYGWRPQIQLGDRATSDRPALAYTSDVTFTSSTFVLHMVWKGSRDDQSIYEADLVNNIWTPQRRISGFSSLYSPVLSTIPLGNGTPSTKLFMAWRGVEGDQGIYYATKDIGGWTPQQKVQGVGSSHRPALANFNGVRMAWKGVEDDHGIYWSTLTPGGWTPQQKIRGIGTSNSPTLVKFNNRLYMFWRGIEDRNVYYSWLDDGPGAIWQPQRVVAYADLQAQGGIWLNIGSTHGPSATVRGNRIMLAWKGGEGDRGIYFSLFDGNEFTGQIRISETGTTQGPSVCTVGAFTHMAWKGVEGDNTIYWSTL
jgi:hypothetical protein